VGCEALDGLKGAKIGVASRWARAGRIGGMVFSFLYLVVWALFGALVRSRRVWGAQTRFRLQIRRVEQRGCGLRTPHVFSLLAGLTAAFGLRRSL
jgi:hypothetical protein